MDPIFCYYPLNISKVLPLYMHFNGWHHHRSETYTVLKSRIFSKLNIQVQKTAFRYQDQGSMSVRQYLICITKYALYNGSLLQITCSFKTQKLCKSIIPKLEVRYPGSKIRVNTCEALRNIKQNTRWRKSDSNLRAVVSSYSNRSYESLDLKTPGRCFGVFQRA